MRIKQLNAKPCYICGCKVIFKEDVYGTIHCNDCWCGGASNIEEWNNRPIEDKLRVEIELLKKQAQEFQLKYAMSNQLVSESINDMKEYEQDINLLTEEKNALIKALHELKLQTEQEY